MTFGKFRDRVSVFADSSADGDPAPDYSGTATHTAVPCKIQIIGGDETFRGRQLEAGISHVVEMHVLSGLNPTMQLSVTGGFYSGATLNIVSVRPKDYDGRPAMLELYCREVPTQR